jgi:hypothetical protein
MAKLNNEAFETETDNASDISVETKAFTLTPRSSDKQT